MAGQGSGAPQPTAAGRFRSQQGERRHDLRAARQIAAGEPERDAAAGGEQSAEKAAVIEAGRCRESEECIGGNRAHGGEIGEVHGEEAAREVRGIEIRREMDAGDLAVDGDGERSAGREHGGVVTDQRSVEL